MTTREQTGARRDAVASQGRREHALVSRVALTHARSAATDSSLHPTEVAAMIEVAELLGSSGLREQFGRLVEIIGGVFPVHAVAIVSTRLDDAPLVWTSGESNFEPAPVTTLAQALLGYFQTDVAFRAMDVPARSAQPQRWLSLPVVTEDGTVLGLLATAPASPVDEASVAFVASVARHLAPLLARDDRQRQVFAARDRAELLVRKTHLRLLEEQRARFAAEWSARALRVTSEATAALLSSFEYAAVLHHVARIVVGHLASGCVIDLEEAEGLRRIAQVSSSSEPTIAVALGPLVARVLSSCTAQTSTRPAAETVLGDQADVSEDAAERARRLLDVDWIVCTPMSVDGRKALGAITVFGAAARHAPMPLSLARELAERAAVAVENGRNYMRAVEALHQREQVLTMVSHDLKNPLGVILMSAARMLEAHGARSAERAENGGGVGGGAPDDGARPDDSGTRGRAQVELIQRSARRMLKLVSDLLDLSAMDAGQIAMTARPVALRPLVTAAFDELASQASASGVELVCEVPETLPPARADSARVTQILVNLIGNAIKFTPAGGRVTARATVLDTEEVAITIADNGIGIHPDHLEHIFDRFWQGPMGFRTGSGLGLAICRSLVERAGGHISAESTPGAGTAITFTLPS